MISDGRRLEAMAGLANQPPDRERSARAVPLSAEIKPSNKFLRSERAT